MTGQGVPLYMVLFSDRWQEGLGTKNIKHTQKERKTASAERRRGESAGGVVVEGGSLSGLGQQSQVGSPAPTPGRGQVGTGPRLAQSQPGFSNSFLGCLCWWSSPGLTPLR